MIYKVSYVVIGANIHGPSSTRHAPRGRQEGPTGTLWFEITDVQDLLPPQGDFAYLHATCRPVEEEKE
jgi:hypothetical protein